MSDEPKDNYSLVETLGPHLWEIILDVLLRDAQDNDQFHNAFYPILETFPMICCCNDASPIKIYWLKHLYRVMATVAGVPIRVMAITPGDPLSELLLPDDEGMPHPRETIQEDAARYNIDMAITRGRKNSPHWHNRNRSPTTADLRTSNKKSKY